MMHPRRIMAFFTSPGMRLPITRPLRLGGDAHPGPSQSHVAAEAYLSAGIPARSYARSRNEMIRMSRMKLTGIGTAHTEPRRLQTGVAPGTDATSSIFSFPRPLRLGGDAHSGTVSVPRRRIPRTSDQPNLKCDRRWLTPSSYLGPEEDRQYNQFTHRQ